MTRFDELQELRRSIAELTTEIRQGHTDAQNTQQIIKELRNAAKEQSGALAVFSSYVLDTKKKQTSMKKY